MLIARGIGPDFQHVVEAGDPSAILGWTLALAADEAGIGESGITLSNIAQGQRLLPVVTKVVGIHDRGRAGSENFAQADARGNRARSSSSSGRPSVWPSMRISQRW